MLSNIEDDLCIKYSIDIVLVYCTQDCLLDSIWYFCYVLIHVVSHIVHCKCILFIAFVFNLLALVVLLSLSVEEMFISYVAMCLCLPRNMVW